MKEEVILIKTVGGEYYLGYCSNSESDTLILNHTRMLNIQMTNRGAGVLAIPVVPFVPKSPDTITIKKEYVLLVMKEDQIEKSLIDNYKTQVTGIVTASKPDIIV